MLVLLSLLLHAYIYTPIAPLHIDWAANAEPSHTHTECCTLTFVIVQNSVCVCTGSALAAQTVSSGASSVWIYAIRETWIQTIDVAHSLAVTNSPGFTN